MEYILNSSVQNLSQSSADCYIRFLNNLHFGLSFCSTQLTAFLALFTGHSWPFLYNYFIFYEKAWIFKLILNTRKFVFKKKWMRRPRAKFSSTVAINLQEKCQRNKQTLRLSAFAYSIFIVSIQCIELVTSFFHE